MNNLRSVNNFIYSHIFCTTSFNLMTSKILLRLSRVYSKHLYNGLCNVLYSSKIIGVNCLNINFKSLKFSSLRHNRHYCTFSQSLKCWNCSEELQAILFKCPRCKALQSVDKRVNFFQILDQNVGYDVKNTILKISYLKLQAEFHPDKFSNSSDNEKAISEEVSSMINRAYSTISNPYKRGLYLLKLHKIPIQESDIQLDHHFLSRIMELNENLEEIEKQSDFELFEKSNEEEIENLTKSISEAFSKNDFKVATVELHKMKYFISIRDRLKAMKPSLFW